jgi:hypothetical protein
MWRQCQETERATIRGVCDITGVDYGLLKAWCHRNDIAPKGYRKNLDGRRRTRLFGVVECVAIAYAFKWRTLGYAPIVCRTVVEFITSFSEEELLAEFAAGRTCLIPYTFAPSQLQEKHCEAMEAFDLTPIYAQVKLRMRDSIATS